MIGTFFIPNPIQVINISAQSDHDFFFCVGLIWVILAIYSNLIQIKIKKNVYILKICLTNS